MTAARRAVFDALLATHEPLTMPELAAACPEIDRASTYRVVSLFENLGVAKRVYSGWKYRLELAGEFVHHHHHATCVACGKILALPTAAALEAHIARAARELQFAMQSHELEITGLCANCSPKN